MIQVQRIEHHLAVVCEPMDAAPAADPPVIAVSPTAMDPAPFVCVFDTNGC